MHDDDRDDDDDDDDDDDYHYYYHHLLRSLCENYICLLNLNNFLVPVWGE